MTIEFFEPPNWRVFGRFRWLRIAYRVTWSLACLAMVAFIAIVWYAESGFRFSAH